VASVKGMCDLALHHFWLVEIHGRDTDPNFNHKRRKKIVMEGTKLDMQLKVIMKNMKINKTTHI
jgi:hypothetical protein